MYFVPYVVHVQNFLIGKEEKPNCLRKFITQLDGVVMQLLHPLEIMTLVVRPLLSEQKRKKRDGMHL